MMATIASTLAFGCSTLSYESVRQVSGRARRLGAAGRVRLDLGRVNEATTSGFAALIALRAVLRRSGGDLCLCGLRGRVSALRRVLKLQDVLPADVN